MGRSCQNRYPDDASKDLYLQPALTVLRFEAEHAILGDSDDEGTEPIIDDGSSHSWT